MSTNGVLGSWNLSAGVPQAIYVCNNDQATSVTLNVCNKSNVPANIRVSIGTGGSLQNNAEFLEFDTVLLPKGVLERNGLIVGPGMYLVVKSDQPSCNAVCWGIEVGAQSTFYSISANAGVAPTWVTPNGSLGTVTVGNPTASDSVTLVATDPNTDTNKLKYTVTSGSLPAGMYLDTSGVLSNKITTTGYTSGTTGQTTSFDVTVSNGTNSAVRSFSITKKWNDGSTAALAAPSGYWLAQNIGPNYLSSGNYWIKSAAMPNALQMYVDMTEEGGGYDFYRITGGAIARYVTDYHSGKPLGLDLVFPRSKYHWRAYRNYVTNVVGSSDYTYFQCISIYRDNANGNGGSGNYTGYPMRSIHYATNGRPSTFAPDWKVPDNGRWWLRDTPYTEPNGNYTPGLFLGDLPGRNGMPSGYNLQDVMFDDSASESSWSTTTNYIVSTNAKP